jgi:hypothetical protein
VLANAANRAVGGAVGFGEEDGRVTAREMQEAFE